MVRNEKAFFDHKRRIVKISISTSAFRNQGMPGLIQHTRNWIMKNVNLDEFAHALQNKKYESYLDKLTNDHFKSAKKFNCHWGTSRKGLNIFLRDILYSSFFFKELKLKWSSGDQLEIPLDSKTMTKIISKYKTNKLEAKGYAMPKQTTIIALDKSNSLKFQIAAREIAKIEYRGYTRVDLDMEFWAE